MSRDKIIQRVRKLLNLNSNTSDFEGEIIAATKAAQELIEKHAIDEAELGEGESQEEEVYGKDSAFTTGANLSRWEATLGGAVMRAVGTVKWYYENRHVRKDPKTGVMMAGPHGATKIIYYGPAEDVAVACEMFTALSQTIVTMALLKWSGAFKGPGLSYCCGFVRALSAEVYRRDEAKSMGERQGITTELAVRTMSIMRAKRTQASMWLKSECGVTLGRGRSVRLSVPSGYNSAAFSEGQTDGRAHGMSVSRTPKIGAQAALPTRKG